MLTPHQGVFDRTAFDDEPAGYERDDLVLEPIVVERPAVDYPRESAPEYPNPPSPPTYAGALAPTDQSQQPTYRNQPPANAPSQPTPTVPQPNTNGRSASGSRYLHESGQTRLPAPRTPVAEPTSSRNRRAPPPTSTTARHTIRSHRRRDGTRLDTSLGHGIPGRGVILLGVLTASAVGLVDIALTDELTLFFSLGFILICLLCALSIRRSDLFTAGVLPPLLLAAVIGVFAFAIPSAVGSPDGSLSHAWVAGLAHHAGGLVAAHTAALLIIALRMLNEPAKRTRAF